MGDKNALETGVLRDHNSAKMTTGMAALSRLMEVVKCGTSSKTGCQWEKDADLGRTNSQRQAMVTPREWEEAGSHVSQFLVVVTLWRVWNHDKYRFVY